jgi:hypothetical protein
MTNLREKIENAIDDNQCGWSGHVSIGSSIDAIMELPEISEAQARIEELEVAIKDVIKSALNGKHKECYARAMAVMVKAS